MAYRIKIVPVQETSIKAGFVPKYSIMIFDSEGGSALKQTPELIEELNECLKNTPLALSGIPFDYYTDENGEKSFT
jgi:hypothetical protein